MKLSTGEESGSIEMESSLSNTTHVDPVRNCQGRHTGVEVVDNMAPSGDRPDGPGHTPDIEWRRRIRRILDSPGPSPWSSKNPLYETMHQGTW